MESSGSVTVRPGLSNEHGTTAGGRRTWNALDGNPEALPLRRLDCPEWNQRGENAARNATARFRRRKQPPRALIASSGRGLVLVTVMTVFGGCGYVPDDGNDAGSPMFDHWRTPSFFRGFDIGYFNYGSGVKSLDDFMALKATGANLAQIQSNEGTVDWAPPYATNQDGVTSLDDMVAWCGQAELYYVIAVREGPGRQSVDIDADDTIWQSSDEQQRYAQMLADIVARYQGDPHFAAINVMVEPNPLRTQIWETIQTPEDLAAALTAAGIDVNAMMTLFIDKIRAVDKTLPIIVQGVVWSNPQWWSLVEKQDDPYVIYDFHTYEPSLFTRADCAAPDCPGVSYPGEYYGQMYDRTFLEEVIFADVIAFQQEHQVPIFMGEFGMQYAQEGGVQFLSDHVDIALSHGWHFALWNFRSDTVDPTLIEFDAEKFPAEYWNEVLEWF